MKLKFVSAEEFYSEYTFIDKKELDACREFTDSDYDFGDFEVRYGYSAGCIIMRYYSDSAGYHFDAPFPLSEESDESEAFLAISEYCKLQAIPETVVGIEPDCLDIMLRGAEKYSIAEDDDGTFVVRIVTECMSCEFLPEVLVDNVYLGEFADSYAEDYEKLLKDVNLNCHFGYNILDDMPDGKGIDFIESARSEFERCESMTFAATVFDGSKNVFVGEGVLYAFDGRGSASVSFRVLPEYQRQGIGTKILFGLLKIAKEIGLKRVAAEVKRENVPSLALLLRICNPSHEDEEKVSFVLNPRDF